MKNLRGYIPQNLRYHLLPNVSLTNFTVELDDLSKNRGNAAVLTFIHITFFSVSLPISHYKMCNRALVISRVRHSSKDLCFYSVERLQNFFHQICSLFFLAFQVSSFVYFLLLFGFSIIINVYFILLDFSLIN